MEVSLRAALTNYFSQLRSTDQRWHEFLEKVKRTLQALKNQSEQYCHVTSKEVDNAEICGIDGLRDKLIFMISAGIESEVSTILNELRRLKNNVENLKTKFARLERARSEALVSEPSFRELVDGTSHIPKLNLLLEWSIESCTHYEQLVNNLFDSFKILDYKCFDKVVEWEKSVDQWQKDQARIKYILGFTQFITKETIK